MLLENINTLESVATHLKQQLATHGYKNYYVIDNEFLAYIDAANTDITFFWNFENKDGGSYDVYKVKDDAYIYHICKLTITITPKSIKVHI